MLLETLFDVELNTLNTKIRESSDNNLSLYEMGCIGYNSEVMSSIWLCDGTILEIFTNVSSEFLEVRFNSKKIIELVNSVFNDLYGKDYELYCRYSEGRRTHIPFTKCNDLLSNKNISSKAFSDSMFSSLNTEHSNYLQFLIKLKIQLTPEQVEKNIEQYVNKDINS